MRLDLHVLRHGVGVIEVGRETPDRGRRGGVGVHGVGGGGLVVVKVGAAVDRRFRRVGLLLLIQRQVRVNGMLMRMVVMRVMSQGVGGDVRREPVGCQGAGCEAKGQRI